MRLAVIGMAAGVILTLTLTRVVSTLLVGVEPHDLATFNLVGILFLIITALASWLPARRAARLDPTVALRQE